VLRERMNGCSMQSGHEWLRRTAFNCSSRSSPFSLWAFASRSATCRRRFSSCDLAAQNPLESGPEQSHMREGQPGVAAAQARRELSSARQGAPASTRLSAPRLALAQSLALGLVLVPWRVLVPGPRRSPPLPRERTDCRAAHPHLDGRSACAASNRPPTCRARASSACCRPATPWRTLPRSSPRAS
jgi:hypothetical protein